MPSAQSIVIGRATAEFGLILFAWILIAWVFRLLYLVLTLCGVRSGKGWRLSIFEDVPMHHTVQQLDLDTRRRFLGFLRSRAPPSARCSVSNYIGPISLAQFATCPQDRPPQSARGSADALLHCRSAGSTFPCTLQIFWADEVHSDLVDISRRWPCRQRRDAGCATGSADSPSCHGSLRGPSCRSRFAASH